MPTPTPLASGLNGAIGSQYRSETNQLFFVEYASGKISRLDLIRPSATTVKSGTTTLKGTWTFNLDTGVQGGTGGGQDIWWEQQTSVKRRMTPRNGSGIALVGKVSYGSVTPAVLQGLPYGPTPINGNNNASNQLVNGTVFAVRTTAGNYAKVQVLQYGYNMKIRWTTYRLASGYKVLGSGYDRPEDIALSDDGQYAYVTERGGKLLRAKLSSANRSAATIVSGGMAAPHQIALDETHGFAYIVEFATAGRLLRINLASGAKTVLLSGLRKAIGLLMTDDRKHAYVSMQDPGSHRVERIEISTSNRETIASGLVNPFFMTWTDPGESGILLAERAPANRISLIDLTKSTPQLSHVANGLPSQPSSVAPVTGSRVLVCSDSVISDVDFIADLFNVAGPLLMGIGHVPKTRISQGGAAAIRGYADTTPDPSYFFQVKDAPFGGTLPVMVNHTKAYAAGARYYRLWAGSSEPLQSWSDYKWNTSTHKFEIQTMAPSSAGYYRLHRPTEIWYNHWLAYRLGTLGLPDGLHRIIVRTYKLRNTSSLVSSDAIWVRIDNHWPTATIDQIVHYLAPSGSETVGPCQIVTKPKNAFRFRITAHDPEGHLKSYRLKALWGDNQSAVVASKAYTPSPSKKWAGVFASLVPSSAWSATEKKCAHTFHLTVWDRVIDGYVHLHRSTYHKSITIFLS
jgi:hypothetical protein